MRRIVLLLVLAALALPAPAPATEIDVDPVAFAVTNPLDGSTHTVRGDWFHAPAGQCDTVFLLIHGLSYGKYAWDFPGRPEYSVARSLAAAGYPAIAVDLPGYERAPHQRPDGYTLTVEGYASMVGQMVSQIRSSGMAAHVGLMGHSAGTEITELAVGLGLADVDVYVPTGYTHVPSQRIATDFFTGDFVRAAQDDYEYFGGTPAGRIEYMYAPQPSANVEPGIPEADNALAVDTPSGEIYSIGPQPSKLVMGLIGVPTLLVLAQHDLLFPVEWADEELALFAGASDKTLHVVPGAGHSFMLHRNAGDTMDVVTGWLAARPSALPAC